MEKYFTRALHSDAKKFELALPDGTNTGDYLMIVGTDSDQFRAARAELRRNAAVISASKDRQAAEIVACLVVGGDTGDGEEVTRERAAELLYQAPYLCDQVDNFAAIHANFLEKK